MGRHSIHAAFARRQQINDLQLVAIRAEVVARQSPTQETLNMIVVGTFTEQMAA